MNNDVVARVVVVRTAENIQQILKSLVCSLIGIAAAAHFEQIPVRSDSSHGIDVRAI